MEDVWKELSLASLDHHYSTSTTSSSSSGAAAAAAAAIAAARSLTLQEFLASPLDPTPPHPKPVSESHKKPPVSNKNPPSEIPCCSSNGCTSTDAAFCACSKRKGNHLGDGNASDDRKKYRLMKNRESAARSRARKQAYTYELELEVAHLMEENSKLREQQEQLCAAALGDHHQKKHKLHRTLTAPF